VARKQTPPTSFSVDPVTRHAERVLSGEFIAGPLVRAACQRHIDDLSRGHERGLSWHPDEVDRVVRYFATILTVEVEREEDGETVSEAVPFVLHESQVFIVGSLFGWKNARGHRRFRRGYIEIGKGNGKSPLAAGIGHYMMTATKKLRAEVYSAATDRDQAAILFRDAVEMWRRSPALYRRLIPSGQNPVWQLTHLESASFFKPISSEKKGKSGIRPYCGLIDEVHEHPDNSVIEMLRAGTKGNQQALILEITNSGSDRGSVCWDEHVYTAKVCTGEEQNDAWFGYICSLDEKDEPFEDESCWVKANPLLGVSIHPEFVREQVAEAKGMPSKENFVRRLHFCQWTDAADSWIPKSDWDAVETQLRLEDYRGEECFAGLDLSYTRDLSALALLFPTGNDTADMFVFFWKPKDGLNEAINRDKAPYDLFAKNGHLFLTEGKVIKLPPIGQKLAEIQNDFDLIGVGYDRYRHRELDSDLLDLGIEVPMFEHPQGFRRTPGTDMWMPDSFQEFENMITERRIRVCTNPLMRRCVSSTVVRYDPAGTDNHIPDKRKSLNRIDGVSAGAMAVGMWRAKLEDDRPSGGVVFA
jgi:phage terminase large subunit-like protein